MSKAMEETIKKTLGQRKGMEEVKQSIVGKIKDAMDNIKNQDKSAKVEGKSPFDSFVKSHVDPLLAKNQPVKKQ